MLTKEEIQKRADAKRQELRAMNTNDIEAYLIKMLDEVAMMTVYKDIATEVLDGRVAIHGEKILTVLKRVAETRAEIRPELMNEGQVVKAIGFAHEQVDAGQWTKFMTVSNAKKVFGKVEAEAIIYNKPIKAQFKLRED